MEYKLLLTLKEYTRRLRILLLDKNSMNCVTARGQHWQLLRQLQVTYSGATHLLIGTVVTPIDRITTHSFSQSIGSLNTLLFTLMVMLYTAINHMAQHLAMAMISMWLTILMLTQAVMFVRVMHTMYLMEQMELILYWLRVMSTSKLRRSKFTLSTD